MYYYTNKNLSISLVEPLEVGFLKRYSFQMQGEVSGSNTSLKNGVIIGGPSNQFVQFIPDQILHDNKETSKKAILNTLPTVKEIIFQDSHDIYSHRYIIKDKRIERLLIDFL